MTVPIQIRIEAVSGDLINLEVDPTTTTGNMLKQKTFSHFQKRPDEQTLWFQNPEHEKLTLIDDCKTLDSHNIAAGAVIKEGRDLGKPDPTASELRRNIATKNNFSYYYAHANESALPESTRYVTGGDPIPLGKNDVKLETTSPAWRTMTQYSWADSDKFVKIYITNAECLAIGKMWDEASSEVEKDKIIGVDYLSTNSIEIRIKDPTSEKAGFKFAFKKLNKEIDIEGSKAKGVRVGSNKITVTLKKADVESKWYDLTSNDSG